MIDITLDLGLIDVNIGLEIPLINVGFELKYQPIDIDLFDDNKVDLDLSMIDLDINTTVDVGTLIPGDPHPIYHGSYEVTPKVHEQSLETHDQIMERDVTVFAIPYSEVSNPQGGETVNIAFIR